MKGTFPESAVDVASRMEIRNLKILQEPITRRRVTREKAGWGVGPLLPTTKEVPSRSIRMGRIRKSGVAKFKDERELP